MIHAQGPTFTARARFVFFKKDNGNEGFTSEEKPRSIQINPSEISISEVYKQKREKGVAKSGEAVQISTGEISTQTVGMRLYFDLQEAYSSYQYEGKRLGTRIENLVEALPGLEGELEGETYLEKVKNAINPNLGVNELNLNNDKFTCYPRIIKAAENKEPVLFLWGHQVYAGIITNFNSNFTYFSPRGEPLRAVMQLTLQVMSDEETKKLVEQSKSNIENSNAEKPSLKDRFQISQI